MNEIDTAKAILELLINKSEVEQRVILTIVSTVLRKGKFDPCNPAGY